MDIIDIYTNFRQIWPTQAQVDPQRFLEYYIAQPLDDRSLHSNLENFGITSQSLRVQLVKGLIELKKFAFSLFYPQEISIPQEYKEEAFFVDELLYVVNEKDSERKLNRLAQLILTAKDLEKKNKNLFDPTHNEFRPDLFFLSSLFLETIKLHKATSFDQKSGKTIVAKKDFLEHVKYLRSTLKDPSLDIAIKMIEDNQVDFLDYKWIREKKISEVINKALEAKGLYFCMSTEGKEFMGVIFQTGAFEKEIGSIKVPVKRVLSLTGNPIGEAFAKSHMIVLPLESIGSESSNKRIFSGIIFNVLASKDQTIDLKKDPNLIYPWIMCNELSRCEDSELEEKYIEHVLAEELNHTHSQRFAEIIASGTLNVNNYFAEAANRILKPNSELSDIYKRIKNTFKECEKINKVGKAIFEFEGQLTAIETSPYTLRSFFENFSDILVSPDRDEACSEDRIYDMSRIFLAKFLTEEALPNGKQISQNVDWDKLLELSINGALKDITRSGAKAYGLNQIREAWVSYLNSEINTREKFHQYVDSKKLANIAGAIHRKLFLSIEEKERIMQKVETK